MRRAEALQGVRMIKFRSVLERYEANEFNQIEAAELLGVTERTFRRWRHRLEDDGEAGLLDRQLGRASGKRVPVDREHEVDALYRTRYSGFTAQHFHDHLVRDRQVTWGYTWTKAFLQSKGLLVRAKRRGPHPRKRSRRPLPGMMLHQDGSWHEWLAGLDVMDLIVTMDDSTNTIYSAFLRFCRKVCCWTDIATNTFVNINALAVPVPDRIQALRQNPFHSYRYQASAQAADR
jgi:transposase